MKQDKVKLAVAVVRLIVGEDPAAMLRLGMMLIEFATGQRKRVGGPRKASK